MAISETSSHEACSWWWRQLSRVQLRLTHAPTSHRPGGRQVFHCPVQWCCCDVAVIYSGPAMRDAWRVIFRWFWYARHCCDDPGGHRFAWVTAVLASRGPDIPSRRTAVRCLTNCRRWRLKLFRLHSFAFEHLMDWNHHRSAITLRRVFVGLFHCSLKFLL